MPKTTLQNGVTLHHQCVGEGPPVVMIHGITGNLAVWHLKIAPLLSDRYRIVTYDLRGHGYSDTPPTGYSAEEMANDLLGLMDALEIERPVVVGHSYGADIALYFAYHHPARVERIVAVEASLPAMISARSRDDWEGWDYWADVLERSGHPVPADRRTDALYLLRASLDVPRKWGPLNGLPRNPKRLLRLLDETSIATDYEIVGELTLDHVSSIRTPTVLMYAEDSAFLATYEFLSAELPNATPILLPATEWGHFGPLEQPELVAEHFAATLATG